MVFCYHTDMQTPKRKPNPYDLIPPDYHMTQAAVDELEREVEKMEQRVRPKIIDEMQAAAEHGDFSENFPYQNAKRRLRALNAKIDEYKRKVAHAVIIDEHASVDRVSVGSTVTFTMDGAERTYTILGAQEADPSKGIISHQTPLGQALLNHRVGDTFEAVINDNSIKIEIIAVK